MRKRRKLKVEAITGIIDNLRRGDRYPEAATIIETCSIEESLEVEKAVTDTGSLWASGAKEDIAMSSNNEGVWFFLHVDSGESNSVVYMTYRQKRYYANGKVKKLDTRYANVTDAVLETVRGNNVNEDGSL